MKVSAASEDQGKRQEIYDAALAELQGLETELKDERKRLRRDWEAMPVRERSAGTRAVKALEERQRELRATLEMYAH